MCNNCNHDNCNCGHHHDHNIDLNVGCHHRDANGISTLIHIGPAPNRVKCSLCGVEFNLLTTNPEELMNIVKEVTKNL